VETSLYAAEEAALIQLWRPTMNRADIPC
jgi:hypothetical protein